MKVFECTRCGKDIEVEKMKQIEVIKCGHCNKEFTVTKKIKNRSFMLVTGLVVVLAFVATLAIELFNLSFLSLLIPALFFGFYAYPISLLILAKLNKLDYMDK